MNYDNFLKKFHVKKTSSVDDYLRQKSDLGQLEGDGHTSVRNIALNAGDRVSFKENLDSLLTYPETPSKEDNGTVVAVKTASGISTTNQNRYFVKWDSGKFLAVERKHLKKIKMKRASDVQITFTSGTQLLDQFTPLTKRANNSELVHKATQDLWHLEKHGSEFVLTRLFNETGEPLKV